MIDPTSAQSSVPLRAAALMRIGLLASVLAVCLTLHARSGFQMDVAALYLYATLAVGLLVAIVTYLWLYSQPAVPTGFVALSLLVDLILVTALTAFSGGMDSIFDFLYTVVILEAAVLHGLPASVAAATAASVISIAVALLDQSGFLAHAAYVRFRAPGAYQPQLWAYAGLRIFAFYLVALLSGHLARRIGHLERQQENLLRQFATGYLAADPEGLVTFINTAGCRILGCTPRTVIGAPVNRIFHTRPPGRDPASLSLRFRKEFFEVPCEHRREDGRMVPLQMTTTFIRTSGHVIDGVMAQFSDQTRMKDLERTVRQQDRLALAGELSASLAHEVRNPVAAIRSAVQELDRDTVVTLDPDEQQLRHIIVREADQLNRVVSHFLDYARVDIQERLPVKVCDLIHEVCTLLGREPGRLAEVTVEVDCDDPTLSVAGDASLLKEALLNLLQNALDAMPDGGTIRLTARPAQRPGQVEILIADTGVGMKAEQMAHLFEPFHTTKESGTGLGLAIVHRIVHGHDGDIDVTSEPGVGTLFRISLPSAE